ncbi:hypothetical protein DFH28DRAFT_825323, partial [Melampsora americana]
HVLALLLMGLARSILSCNQYLLVRLVFQLCKVILPDWGVLQALFTWMKKRVGLELLERMSPEGKPLFGLKVETIIRNELVNPLISPHIVFVPKQAINTPINRFSQCQKWREGYTPDLCVQMIAINNHHFYIYEPVQLCSQQLVVPMFFFQQNDTLLAKCMPAKVESNLEDPAYLKVIVLDDPPFDSPKFITIKCNDFGKTCEEIELYNGY